MPYNIILYCRLPYFYFSNSALFSTKYFSTLILYRCDLDTLYFRSYFPYLTKYVPDINVVGQNLYKMKKANESTSFH